MPREKKEGYGMILTIISKLIMCYYNKIRMIFNSISFLWESGLQNSIMLLICFLRKSILSFIRKKKWLTKMWWKLLISPAREFLRNWSCVSKYSGFTTEKGSLCFEHFACLRIEIRSVKQKVAGMETSRWEHTWYHSQLVSQQTQGLEFMILKGTPQRGPELPQS